MLRKAYVERCMVTNGWVSLDPADLGLIEAVYKKTLRESEERLMLAVLESAVEDFQKYGLRRKRFLAWPLCGLRTAPACGLG